jgi:hypothetical protein
MILMLSQVSHHPNLIGPKSTRDNRWSNAESDHLRDCSFPAFANDTCLCNGHRNLVEDTTIDWGEGLRLGDVSVAQCATACSGTPRLAGAPKRIPVLSAPCPESIGTIREESADAATSIAPAATTVRGKMAARQAGRVVSLGRYTVYCARLSCAPSCSVENESHETTILAGARAWTGLQATAQPMAARHLYIPVGIDAAHGQDDEKDAKTG